MIVDTNALLIPAEFGVDIFEELDRLGYLHVIVPRMVLNELEQLKMRRGLKGKERMAAKVGDSLLRKYIDTAEKERLPTRCTVSIEEAEEGEGMHDTDALIAALARKRKAAVLTIDEELRLKLSQAGIVTICLRGRNRLEECD